MSRTEIDKLREYDRLYYTEGTSPISDSAYDLLKEEARSKYPDDNYFYTVGHKPVSKNVELPYVLGSLNKTKPDSIDKWVEEHPSNSGYLISQKLDGVSFIVVYKDGEVQFASTRGNGIVGKDITNKAKKFCMDIDNRSTIIMRGEAMLLNDVYKELGYKTARNGVAGILNRDDDKYLANIYPFFYELIKFADLQTFTEYERFVLIESLGFDTPKWELIKDFDINKVLAIININSPYYIDGAVVSINECERENVLFPKNKVAFKIQGTSAKTKVENVKWSVSRTGRLMPVIEIEPVTIDGTTISNVTGFNARFIEDNYIQKGVGVEIIRSGDVIPHVIHVTNNLSDISLPEKCPSCGSFLETKGVDLVCKNKGCQPRVLKNIEYFLVTLGAEHVRYKILEKLNVFSLADAYNLDEFEIAELDGFGVRSGELIVNEIQKTLHTTQEKLLQAFAIPGVGKEMANALISCFGSMDVIFDLREIELQECNGIGPKIAENIVKNARRCRETYKYLEKIGLKFKDVGGNSMLKGKSVTLTGAGPMGRKELQGLIEEAGGTVKGISKDVDILVTNDLSSNSGKMKKAKQYGITIITYDELMEMLK